MTSDILPRAARRRIKKLAEKVDRVLDGDRQFFERHKGRSYRLRLASAVEIEQTREISQAEGATPPGWQAGFRWFCVVRQFAPGVRARVFFGGPADNETDVAEAEARWLYHREARESPTVRAANAQMEALSATIAPPVSSITDSYGPDDPEDICPRLDYPDEGGAK